MKLIITGASGFVGTELLRQSLGRPEITSVIAVARRPVAAPPGIDGAKLKSVVIEDYCTYPENVKKEFANAHACIWTVAITPSKAKVAGFEEARRVSQTSALAGFQAMHESVLSKPFRFIYMSGVAAERDQTKIPKFMPEYSLMRGEAENQVLAFASTHGPGLESCAAKCGYITGNGSIVRYVWATGLRLAVGVPINSLDAVTAAMLDQVINGFTTEPLLPEDLERLGKAALGKD